MLFHAQHERVCRTCAVGAGRDAASENSDAMAIRAAMNDSTREAPAATRAMLRATPAEKS
jgi:hypothetical protein